jgi:hypothetical protein
MHHELTPGASSRIDSNLVRAGASAPGAVRVTGGVTAGIEAK